MPKPAPATPMYRQPQATDGSALLAASRAIGIALLFLIGFLLIIPTGAFIRPRNRVASAVKQKWMQVSLKVLGFRVTVHGHAPATHSHSSNTLWVSNHVSWTDINVLNSLGQVTFLSKAEVRHWPIVGGLASVAGTLFVQRGAGQGNQAIDDVAHVLDQEQSVVVFPEATTTDGSDVRRFFHPILKAALIHSHPITPITIRYLRGGQPCAQCAYYGDDVFTKHLWRILHYRDVSVAITFHKPIQTQRDDNAKELAKSLRDTIAEPIAELKNQLSP